MLVHFVRKKQIKVDTSKGLGSLENNVKSMKKEVLQETAQEEPLKPKTI